MQVQPYCPNCGANLMVRRDCEGVYLLCKAGLRVIQTIDGFFIQGCLWTGDYEDFLRDMAHNAPIAGD